jgi:hypothetical protein
MTSISNTRSSELCSHPHFAGLRIRAAWLFALGHLGFAVPAVRAAPAGEDDMARQLLFQALENQYRGRYQAALEIVEDSFIKGKDSLNGLVEFADEVGERKISLAGPQKAFEYQSLNFGKEQWLVDERSHRVRRIANRQWKKGLLGNLFTFEDLLKFPSDFFLEYSSCKGVKTTDSTYQVTMMLRPSFQSVYAKLEVTLLRQPVVLKSITFFGPQDQRLKTMEILGYKAVDGKQLASDLQVFDCDSLSNLRMCFRKFSFSESPVAQKSGSSSALMTKIGFNGAQALPSADGVEADAPEETSN